MSPPPPRWGNGSDPHLRQPPLDRYLIPIYDGCVKAISLHVDEESYRELKALAERTGRPVAELIREAMGEYTAHRRGAAGSLFDLAPHPSGPLRAPWTRAELLDERLRR